MQYYSVYYTLCSNRWTVAMKFIVWMGSNYKVKQTNADLFFKAYCKCWIENGSIQRNNQTSKVIVVVVFFRLLIANQIYTENIVHTHCLELVSLLVQLVDY